MHIYTTDDLHMITSHWSHSHRREGKFVPIIVSSCIEEVEARGINEVGIYRVSGLTGQVQYLKKAFDKSLLKPLTIGTCNPVI